ncbi:MAG TPA: type VI secretion system-associated FHA domain protein TagH [Rhizobiaceae bacterium]|nr:type VI secretion system-associated FHA domain protein TagH [Rhizobiaceae bacterium]
MYIRLTIDNVDKLPNGGPLSFTSHGRNFEIGRENRDWTLPDPKMFVSGRHCEIRYDGQAFWLHDLSRNGTFVNGSSRRLAAPHRLNQGDRVRIGPYVVCVSIGDAADSTKDRGAYGAEPPSPLAAGGTPSAEAPGTRPATGSESAAVNEILREMAASAGVPPAVFLQRDPHALAAEIGSVLRIVVEELAALLRARASAKALAKSSHRTMIGAQENNPLKFVPGTDEMLEIMFSRRRAGYLSAKESLEQAFGDLKTHELATYSAMQSALSRLLDDFSPEAIEKRLPPSAFGSRKSRAWETFVATWEARENAHENGMLDVFLAYFSEAYAKAAKPK